MTHCGRCFVLGAALMVGIVGLHAQPAQPLEFDVASIKPNTLGPSAGGGMRTLPDGTMIMSNQGLITVLIAAAPVPVLLRNVVGLPDWAMREPYNVTVRPPAGTTPDQWPEMWRTLFEKRMHFTAHVEQREATTYSLILARRDGKLGPQLTKSSLDCAPGAQGNQAPSANPATRCGLLMGPTSIVSGGIAMDMLARNLQGHAGGPTENRTGLEGFYAFTLTFSPPGVAANAAADAPPEFFTALEDQLGLKLQSQKGTVPYYVVDHVERPTED